MGFYGGQNPRIKLRGEPVGTYAYGQSELLFSALPELSIRDIEELAAALDEIFDWPPRNPTVVFRDVLGTDVWIDYEDGDYIRFEIEFETEFRWLEADLADRVRSICDHSTNIIFLNFKEHQDPLYDADYRSNRWIIGARMKLDGDPQLSEVMRAICGITGPVLRNDFRRHSAERLYQSALRFGPTALLGHPEGQHLEFKKLYEYQNPATHVALEMALDVSSFANSQDGGLIAVGYEEKPDRDGNMRVHLAAISNPYPMLLAIRSAINSYITPRIEGLSTEVLGCADGGGVVLIHVPPQANGSFPFVVQAPPRNRRDKIDSLFVAVAERRGDSKYTHSIHQIQQWMHLGSSA